ncbi:MAG: glycosyltransferase family 2 protein [Spirochaetota bacterium]|nr:glycosyltransferase family 2 protein [Spirochaetota bacterium]
MSNDIELSIILPVFNEEKNIPLQFENIISFVDPLEINYEIIFVDDGSTDNSFGVIKEISKNDSRVKALCFRKNFGQTAAMAAGIEYSKGDVIVTMDSDLQNDAKDIKRLLKKINEGYDVVSGWRRERKDGLLYRRIPSIIANWLISKISGVKLHDLGCSLKAYRREVLQYVKLYGEMHRFIPIHVSWEGAKITEIQVEHHSRKFGISNYGLKRTFKVILDLITVKFMGTYSTKPIYVFGGIGLILFIMSIFSGSAVIIMKMMLNHSMIRNPLFHLTVMLITLSMMVVLLGILAEILIRVYHETQGQPPYRIREVVNIKK